MDVDQEPVEQIGLEQRLDELEQEPAELGSDEQIGLEAVTAERSKLEVELTQLQKEELTVTLQKPSEDEDGTQHPEPPPPDEQAHTEYDPTPPADDDYAVPS